MDKGALALKPPPLEFSAFSKKDKTAIAAG
jgi:hypothetical protein